MLSATITQRLHLDARHSRLLGSPDCMLTLTDSAQTSLSGCLISSAAEGLGSLWLPGSQLYVGKVSIYRHVLARVCVKGFVLPVFDE